MIRGSVVVILIAAFAAEAAKAQEIDTAIQANTATKRETVLDQMAPGERRDFEKFYSAKDPAKRRELAADFVAQHPQSWFLAQAYEAEAKASIELGHYDDAVLTGRLSLRLFPENALLLVPLANVEAQMGKLRDAARDARRALDALGDEDHGEEQNELRGSAHFALARVSVAMAVTAPAGERMGLYEQALDESSGALKANPADGESWLLRGMVTEALNRPDDAAADYKHAMKLEGEASQLAVKHLQVLYTASKPGTETYDDFVRQIPEAKAPAVPANTESERQFAGRYAGSNSCAECHAKEHSAWKKTGMARMLRVYAPENVFGDFRKSSEFRDARGTIVARFGDEKRPYIELRDASGDWHRYPVAYTIGSKWQQAYVTQMDGGRLQVLPLQYSRTQGRWLNYWKLIDPENSARANPLLFSQLTSETNYQLNCAVCHTSQLKAESSSTAAMEKASFRETGINCEMCHGPSEEHVERTHGQTAAAGAGRYPLDFSRLNNRQGVAVCAQCHKQSSAHGPNERAELNYSSRGDTFIAESSVRPLGDFLRKAFYKDGRFRQTTFIVEAFTRSRCYRDGTAQCASCHDPHPRDAEHNPVSLKFRDDPDRMCTQCHAGMASRIEGHTHHAAASEASRCVSCHMPKIMDSLMFKARSHQIDEVPDAAMTARFGQEESPNACLECHQDRDTSWVAGNLERWKQ